MLIRRLSLPNDLGLLGQMVTSVRSSQAHVLTARRNAWHDTLLNRYTTSAAIFTETRSARQAAEDQRGRGTFFEVDEMPALVFDLAQLSLVVTHLNVSPPFRSWNRPNMMTERRLSMTGMEVFNIFSSAHYREATSGWRIGDGEPTVIMGLVNSESLSKIRPSQLRLERSSVASDGWMYFTVMKQTRANRSHLDRIIDEIGHLCHRRLRVHEVADRFRISSSQVLELLARVGAPAKGPRTWVEAEVMEQLGRWLKG